MEYIGDKPIKQMWYGNKQILFDGGQKGITITVDHTKVASDLTDFVMTVNPTDLWATTLAEAQSIRVYKADGTTELPRDIVTATKMKIKTDLSSSVDTVLKVVMDKVSPDYGATTTYGRNNVYTGFKAVYDFASGNSTDRTGNGYNGTDTSITYAGDYASFNGSSSKITLPYFTLTSNFTLSFSIDRTGSRDECIFRNGNSYTGGWYTYNGRDFLIKSDARFDFRSQWLVTVDSFSTPTSLSGLREVSVVYNGSNIKYYIDWSLNATIPNTGTPWTWDSIKTIWWPAFRDGQYLTGKLWRVYMSQSTILVDYISTQYNNTSSPSTFYTVTL